MTREQKNQAITELTDLIKANKVMYLADTSSLDAEATHKLRKECFNKKIQMKVVKNTLLQKAMERVEEVDYSPIYAALKGNTALMFSDTGNLPARLIKDFRKGQKGVERPILKGAYVEESIYVGDNMLDTLCNIKSKNELLGDVIALLQSPAKNVISALQSGKHTIAGMVKTLQEKNN